LLRGIGGNGKVRAEAGAEAEAESYFRVNGDDRTDSEKYTK
jgi:hypothetical protein